MNLTAEEKKKVEDNKNKISELILETQKIIGHQIDGINFTQADSVIPGARRHLVFISFQLEDL
jgi:hypothetical protein